MHEPQLVLCTIKHAAANLNELTDKLATQVAAVEAFLSSCNIGVEAHRPYGSSSCALSYVRIGKKFRIAVQQEGATSFTPWSDCPRAIKLESIAYLTDLLRQIEKKVCDKVNEADAQRLVLDEVITKLLAKEPTP